MIKFREKRYEEEDLTPEVLEHLKADGQSPVTIKESEADHTSQLSSKSLVLYKAVLNKNNRYEIQVMDKEFYKFTRKLLTDRLGLVISSIDESRRLVTAEDKYKGKVLNAIDILGRMYKLYIVVR